MLLSPLASAAATGLRTGHIARPNEKGPGKGEACLVRLAAPFDHLALYVPASPRVEEPAPGGRLLEPEDLVEAVTVRDRER